MGNPSFEESSAWACNALSSAFDPGEDLLACGAILIGVHLDLAWINLIASHLYLSGIDGSIYLYLVWIDGLPAFSIILTIFVMHVVSRAE
jgi:hypothetical protein